MPTRADHATGRWTISLMGWEPLPEELVTLAQLLSGAGYHTAAITDTPFYLRQGMNYDRGFQTFVSIPGQGGGAAPNWFMGKEFREGFTAMGQGHHESWDVRDRWRLESDRNTLRTMTAAADWLEQRYKETSSSMWTPGTHTSRGTLQATTPSYICRTTTARWWTLSMPAGPTTRR